MVMIKTGRDIVSCPSLKSRECFANYFDIISYLINLQGNTKSLAAIHTNGQFLKRNPGYLTDVFQLIFGGKIAAANVAGLHLKCASPNLSLIFSCLHFNMTRWTNKSTSAATDTNGRIFIVRRTYRLLRAPTG